MEKRHLFHNTATGIVLDDDLSHLLLIKREKGEKAGWWFPPGGHIEIGEYPHEALIREVEEETGYKIEIIMQNMNIGTKLDRALIMPQPYWILLEDIGDHFHYDMIYICRIIHNNEKARPEYNFHWFAVSEINDILTPLDVKLLISRIR